jgi:hypothetical protein
MTVNPEYRESVGLWAEAYRNLHASEKAKLRGDRKTCKNGTCKCLNKEICLKMQNTSTGDVDKGDFYVRVDPTTAAGLPLPSAAAAPSPYHSPYQWHQVNIPSYPTPTSWISNSQEIRLRLLEIIGNMEKSKLLSPSELTDLCKQFEPYVNGV